MIIKGHTVKKGKAEGEAIVLFTSFSFVGDLDIAKGDGNYKHELAGKNIVGKILVFPTSRGTTSAALAGYYVKLLGKMPIGMICQKADPVIALNAIMNDFPIIDRLEVDPITAIKTGDYVKINADEGTIEVTPKKRYTGE